MKISVCMFGALLAIALVPTAVAHADTTDDNYLNALAVRVLRANRIS